MFAFQDLFNIQHKVEAIYKTVQNMNKNKIGYSMLPSIRTVPVSGHLKQKLNF